MQSKIFNLRFFLWVLGVGVLTTSILTAGIFFIVIPKLPAIENLKDIQFSVPLRIYTRDEKLIAEFGEKKRSPLKIEETPKVMIDAILSAEDDRFYEHMGVDFKGMLRAVAFLLRTGEKGQGGSTITMQVARNFFLSSEKTYLRKLTEILLSFKIERYLTKNEILELYLNKIYLGNRSYGFDAASKVYYGKPVGELVTAQAAMLAGLPKAPSKYNPVVNRKRAIQRRNYVLSRMNKLGHLDDAGLKEAMAFIDDSKLHGLNTEVTAPYVAEMVRAEVVERYKDDAYTTGLKVYTSINSRLQIAANKALNKALLDYSERHGYRGAESHVELDAENTEEDWATILADFSEFNDLWPALVLETGEKDAIIYHPEAGKVILKWTDMSWARPWIGDGKSPGAAPKVVSDIISRGDIIRISKTGKGEWHLTQMPNVEGSLVSLAPEDGSVLALVGGFNFSKSKFNRVLQAERQPGSNLKPFNYSAALEKGFTAASLINDAPVVFEDAGLESTWRPENYSGQVFGPTRLRIALLKSRNLVSIRLLRAIGISYAIEYLQRFGFNKARLPKDLSLALGSAAVTPMELVTGYAVFANGGYKVEPYFIDRIVTDEDVPLYVADPEVVCRSCEEADSNNQVDPLLMPVGNDLLKNSNPPAINGTAESAVNGQNPRVALDGEPTLEGETDQPKRPRVAKRVVPADNVYIMTTIMKDVIQKGTGRRARALGRNDIAGKTGTTNDQRDAWFSGFTPDVVTTAWVGFDTPKPLGENETGGHAALPMWITYMREALRGLPERQHERPPGLVNVRIDPATGLLAGAGQQDGEFEIFRIGHVPGSSSDGLPDADLGGSNVEGGPQSVSPGTRNDGEDQLF